MLERRAVACRGFNEAAGIPRGRRSRFVTPTNRRLIGFNEAAGIPRGRRPLPSYCLAGEMPASMRPRVFPAEDVHEQLAELRRQKLQ